ncbi:MAG: SDR family oxidoreductase [Flavobacteriales bacterium]|nr:SDR family oxidoreductase [Flavobacteriales bacterium]
MRVLITGGAGYIGTALCEALLEDPSIDRVTIYDNLSRHNYNAFIGILKLDQRFHFIEGDILDSRNLRKAVRNADAVFHLAAKVTTPFADQDAHLFEQVNHWGTAEVTYAVEESDVQRLIYLSSVSVYGSGEERKGLGVELNPKTFYGISKMRGEEHVRRLEDKVKTHIIRCGNVYGYNKSMRFDAVINKLLFEANFRGTINVHGTGEQHRPFIFIDTVSKHLHDVLNDQKQTGTINLVEHNYSINDIVEVLKELYPEMEMIFINNNMKLRELKVDTAAGNLADPAEGLGVLRDRLASFKKEFTF